MSRRALELAKRKTATEVRLDIVSRQRRRPVIGDAHTGRRTRGLLERDGEIVKRILTFKLAQWLVEIPQQGANRGAEAGVTRNAAADEWQRLSVQDLLDSGGRDVGGAIAEGPIISGAAVVQLVGMEDDHLPR